MRHLLIDKPIEICSECVYCVIGIDDGYNTRDRCVHPKSPRYPDDFDYCGLPAKWCPLPKWEEKK